jgi:hypothetical protein
MSMKSPNTAGGVNLFGGRGPFHPLILKGWRGSLRPGGELEIALEFAFTGGREGDTERALAPIDVAGVFRSHVLASAPGKPIFSQKSSNTAARS